MWSATRMTRPFRALLVDTSACILTPGRLTRARTWTQTETWPPSATETETRVGAEALTRTPISSSIPDPVPGAWAALGQVAGLGEPGPAPGSGLRPAPMPMLGWQRQWPTAVLPPGHRWVPGWQGYHPGATCGPRAWPVLARALGVPLTETIVLTTDPVSLRWAAAAGVRTLAVAEVAETRAFWPLMVQARAPPALRAAYLARVTRELLASGATYVVPRWAWVPWVLDPPGPDGGPGPAGDPGSAGVAGFFPRPDRVW